MSIGMILGSCPLFRGLYDKEIDAFTENGQIEFFEAGQIVISPNDLIEKLYIVLEGSLEQYHLFEDERLCFLELTSKDFFGENLFSNESHHDHLVQSVSDSQLLSITFDSIQAFYQKQPKAYSVLLMNILRHEQEMLRVSRGLISRLYFKEKAMIGTPIYGQRRLKPNEVEEIIKKKKAG
ncbi:MAG: cyclic nucleotide-binding domain-containing protein [Deltaproteobacteria bacterium]|nr:MAG: cyclic nucleotide-binding domain-containing protein [Deltaproteobacteria bacterium]